MEQCCLQMLAETMNQLIYTIVINCFKRVSDGDSRHGPNAELDVAFLVPLS